LTGFIVRGLRDQQRRRHRGLPDAHPRSGRQVGRGLPAGHEPVGHRLPPHRLPEV